MRAPIVSRQGARCVDFGSSGERRHAWENVVNEIDSAIGGLPESLLARSGAIFYTGRAAFTGVRPIYLLGLNPGGNPDEMRGNTIARYLEKGKQRPERWSEYQDEPWQGAAPGIWGMQPRIRHLADRLGVCLHDVPASNVVFVRTRNERDLNAEKRQLMSECWPVHEAVIQTLKVRAIICLGKTAGHWVRRKLNAREAPIAKFIECNKRKWISEAHRASDDRLVFTLTHPSIAKWQCEKSDPTQMVLETLDREVSGWRGV